MDTDSIWKLLLKAGVMAAELERDQRSFVFGVGERAELQPLPHDCSNAVLAWCPGSGWQSRLSPEDPRSALLDLYLPICSATSARPVTIGHLGQSLDGFIATPSGDSQFVTGDANLVHLHRMRALCGTVVVGAGTVAADDPQLTTRHVPGPNPLRVVFDPTRRLSASYRVFTDESAETLYVCTRSRVAVGETHRGGASIIAVDDDEPRQGMRQLVSLLRERGCSRVFVEGGGITVSAFLEADLLDRLQIAIAPLLIGEGRPAIRLAPQASLRECRRPAYRVFRMGGDVLFDCELRVQGEATETAPRPVLVTRVI